MSYGPDFELNISPGNRKNMNSKETLQRIHNTIIGMYSFHVSTVHKLNIFDVMIVSLSVLWVKLIYCENREL